MDIYKYTNYNSPFIIYWFHT